VAANGMMLEQAQILTTHNLARWSTPWICVSRSLRRPRTTAPFLGP